MDNVMCAMRDL